MKTELKIGLVLAVVAVFAAVAWADSVLTAVYFNVPSSVSFTITVPGGSPQSSPSTTDIEFNSSIPTANKINCTSRGSPFNSQNATVPCFNYTNTGNRVINITAQFGSALPAGVTVKAGYNNTAWAAACTPGDYPLLNASPDCVYVNSSAAAVIASIEYQSYRDVWMWADFNNVASGTATNRTLSSVSVAG